MMGTKKLSEIKANLLAKYKNSGVDVDTWFDAQIQQLEGKKPPKLREIEVLRLIRDGLRNQKKKKRGSRKPVRSS